MGGDGGGNDVEVFVLFRLWSRAEKRFGWDIARTVDSLIPPPSYPDGFSLSHLPILREV